MVLSDTIRQDPITKVTIEEGSPEAGNKTAVVSQESRTSYREETRVVLQSYKKAEIVKTTQPTPVSSLGEAKIPPAHTRNPGNQNPGQPLRHQQYNASSSTTKSKSTENGTKKVNGRPKSNVRTSNPRVTSSSSTTTTTTTKSSLTVKETNRVSGRPNPTGGTDESLSIRTGEKNKGQSSPSIHEIKKRNKNSSELSNKEVKRSTTGGDTRKPSRPAPPTPSTGASVLQSVPCNSQAGNNKNKSRNPSQSLQTNSRSS